MEHHVDLVGRRKWELHSDDNLPQASKGQGVIEDYMEKVTEMLQRQKDQIEQSTSKVGSGVLKWIDGNARAKKFFFDPLENLELAKCEKFSSLNNECLISSILVGHLLNMVSGDNSSKEKYQAILNPRRKSKEDARRRGDYLLEQIEKVKESTTINFPGPHELSIVVPQMAEYLKAQIVVYGISTEKIDYMYPTKFQFDLEPIYLFQYPNESGVNHVVLINKLSSFFNSHGHICPGKKNR